MAVLVVRSKIGDLCVDGQDTATEFGWFLFELDLHRHHAPPTAVRVQRSDTCQVGRHHRHRWHGVRMPLRPS